MEVIQKNKKNTPEYRRLNRSDNHRLIAWGILGNGAGARRLNEVKTHLNEERNLRIKASWVNHVRHINRYTSLGDSSYVRHIFSPPLDDEVIRKWVVGILFSLALTPASNPLSFFLVIVYEWVRCACGLLSHTDSLIGHPLVGVRWECNLLSITHKKEGF